MRSLGVERTDHTSCVIGGATWLPVERGRSGEARAMDDRLPDQSKHWGLIIKEIRSH